jgi:hypothetical protein
MKRKEESLWKLWDRIKRASIEVTGAEEGLENTKCVGSLFKETITENSQNLMKDTNIHVQEGQMLYSFESTLPQDIFLSSFQRLKIKRRFSRWLEKTNNA